MEVFGWECAAANQNLRPPRTRRTAAEITESHPSGKIVITKDTKAHEGKIRSIRLRGLVCGSLVCYVDSTFVVRKSCAYLWRLARYWCRNGPHVCWCRSKGCVQLSQRPPTSRETGAGMRASVVPCGTVRIEPSGGRARVGRGNCEAFWSARYSCRESRSVARGGRAN